MLSPPWLFNSWNITSTDSCDSLTIWRFQSYGQIRKYECRTFFCGFAKIHQPEADFINGIAFQSRDWRAQECRALNARIYQQHIAINVARSMVFRNGMPIIAEASAGRGSKGIISVAWAGTGNPCIVRKITRSHIAYITSAKVNGDLRRL